MKEVVADPKWSKPMEQPKNDAKLKKAKEVSAPYGHYDEGKEKKSRHKMDR